MSVEGFRKMVRRAGEAAGLPFTVHPHMLRHACGYKLANDGQDRQKDDLQEVRFLGQIGHTAGRVKPTGFEPLRTLPPQHLARNVPEMSDFRRSNCDISKPTRQGLNCGGL
jgi:hypothetical protein